MFTAEQERKLVSLGWAPQFDDRMRVIAFDKWVKIGEVITVPGDIDNGRLVKYAALMFEQDSGKVVAEKYGVRKG